MRSAVPAHVTANPDYLAFIDELAEDPAQSAVMDKTARYDPEQVFYIRGLPVDAAGETSLALERPNGDGFAISYDTQQFTKTVRWILANADQAVCAFALPSTCEPEGYTAEQAKGHVRQLASAERADFTVRLGYCDKDRMKRVIQRIERLGKA